MLLNVRLYVDSNPTLSAIISFHALLIVVQNLVWFFGFAQNLGPNASMRLIASVATATFS
jgi:hypothetical protein